MRLPATTKTPDLRSLGSKVIERFW